MKLVIRVDPENRAWWKKSLSMLLPDFEIFLWDEDKESYKRDNIDVIVTWCPPFGEICKFKNLKCVVSVGAGVSHILNDKTYPRHVPIIRTTGKDLRNRMAEYIALHVLRFHRKMPEIEACNEEGIWKQYVVPVASNYKIGILGVGNLGSHVANILSSIGYKVMGWSKSEKEHDFLVNSYTGTDGLEQILSEVDYLICMLPQTDETNDLLNHNLFHKMKKGMVFINVGRGETIVDQDLVEAIDEGYIKHAVLDVFRNEPLSSDHIFRNRKEILITCHTASAIEPATGGEIISDNIKKFISGEIVDDLVDLNKGY